MNFGEWEARLVDNFDQMSVELYLVRRTPQGKEVLTGSGKIVQIKSGTAVKKNLQFAWFEREQLQAIAEAFAHYGVKTINDHKAQGILEATQTHLEDMRKLVFDAPKSSKGSK